MGKRIFITGAAGFIGYHLASFLKSRGDFVIGLDNFNPYYDPKLKETRALKLQQQGIIIARKEVSDTSFIEQLLEQYEISHVVHLAAQAGVRHSLTAPNDYVSSNLQGFVSIIEACRKIQNLRFIYASSSSVYGLNKKTPFSIDDPTDSPANLYGATKKANEAIAFAYHHLYGLKVTGLRFFTAYGPWGRPDMAYYRFTDKILGGEPIQVFNQGKMSRDFTYIDDIVEGTAAAMDLGADCEIFNLGNNQPIPLSRLIELIEKNIEKRAIQELLPMQQGEVLETCADIEKSRKLLNFNPKISIEEGIARFIHWYRSYVYTNGIKSYDR